MRAREASVDLPRVITALEELADLALASGAEAAWLAARVDPLFDALLELDQARAGYAGRHRHTRLQRDQRLAKAKHGGAGIDELQEISGLSRSQVYRRLRAVAPTMRQFRGITRRRQT